MRNKVFTIIFAVLFTALPLVILDSKYEFFQKQFVNALMLNLVSFFLIGQFVIILKINEKLKKVLLVALIGWFCVLPLLFYKTYINEPLSFTYKKEYLKSLKNSNQQDISIIDSNFINLNSEFKTLINSKISKLNLPEDDTIILFKNYIFLSPRIISGGAGLHTPPTFIKVFDKNNGKLLLKFERKNNLLESYKSVNLNTNFKYKKISNPEVGINYFDFWCSSIIGFRDDLIIPLRSWILVLNFLFASIVFVPLYNFIQSKYFVEKEKKDEDK